MRKETEKINIKRILRKKWVIPALYLIAAAAVLSSIYYYQMGSTDQFVQEDEQIESTEVTNEPEAIEVTATKEVVMLPVNKEEEFTIVNGFYDVNGKEEDQEAALVYYNQSYYPNEGIDYAHVDGENFDVIASLSGTVTKAEKDPALGYVVEISHEDDYTTHYHSLEQIDVEIGTKVEQGDVLGQAGRNLYNEEAGVHVHFEIRHQDKALNPTEQFHRPLGATKLGDDDKKKEEEDEDDKDDNEKAVTADEDETDKTDEDDNDKKHEEKE